MTLDAHDPTVYPAGLTTFQIRVDEKVFGRLDLMVSIARIKDEVTIKEPFVPHFHGYTDEKDLIFKGPVPDWPSDDTLKDTRQFYILKESEWQGVDWIDQYLQLVICTHDRRISNEDLSKMKIVKVAIQTSIDDAVPLNERLKVKRAILYIMFKGLKTPYAPRQVFEIGEHIERKVIVRRVLDERTGDLTLTGMLLGGKRPSKALESGEQAQSSIKRPRLA
ncbi:hypothetical protein V5N11_007289 [Cardamine amara subsp. amara]|uniref:Uncharacterized protein n=1 Tax=Cardamine amara subsp. amara TaxID=228776 RepID=A0ABD1C324_CARAN